MRPRLSETGPAHAPVLAALHASAFERPWPEEEFVSMLSNARNFGAIASLGAEPAGFVLVRSLPDEAEILTLLVAPPHRRKGLARALMIRALEAAAARELKRLVLEVSFNNAPARALYDSLGFAVIGRRPAYYQAAKGFESALVLARDLVVPARATK